MTTYELTYIISPEITSEEAEAKGKEIELAIQSREGIILKQSNPVAKTLAYPVAKRASGFFGVLEFKLEPEKLLEVKEIVSRPSGVPGKIVRHMLIIKEPVKPRKERRSKKSETPVFEKKEEKTEIKSPESKPVELKDIEQQLDELLGE